MRRGEDFDYIGMSYYPFWHGSLKMLEDNMNDIAKRYHKDIIIAEVSMGYTMEDYKEYEKLEDHERKGYATRQELVDKIDYPMTVQGQMDFTADFLNRVANVAIAPRYVATWRRCIAIEKTGVIMGLSTKTKIITDEIKGEKEKEK